MEKVRVGLIGTGWIGTELGRAVLKNPDGELVALCNRTEAKAREFMKEEGFSARVYTDYRKFLEQDDVEAVLICTPNYLHAEMTLATAQAGKHILCEKPMALNLDDCRAMVEAVKRAGVKFLIGYHRRFNPLYQFAKRLLDEGYFGDLFYVESDYIHHVPADWEIWSWVGKEEIGGSLFHAGSGHNVDLLCFFAGKVKEVACFKDIYLPRKEQVETEDTAIATLRFENGAIGKVFFCVGPIKPFTFNFSLYGTKGTLINNRLWLDTFPEFYEFGREKDYTVLPESWIPDNVQGGIGEPWNKEVDHFIDCVKNDKPTANNEDSALHTSEVCFAAVKAAQEKRVMSLPL